MLKIKSLCLVILITILSIQSAFALNRKEAFSALMDGKKVQPSTWSTTTWHLELGGVGVNAGDAPDQVMMVISASDKRAYTHWPDVTYSIYEVAVPITSTQLGNAVASETKKVAPTLTDAQISSLASGIKSAVGL